MSQQSDSQLLHVLVEGQKEQSKNSELLVKQMNQMQVDMAEIKGSTNLRLAALESWRDGQQRLMNQVVGGLIVMIVGAILVAVVMRGIGFQSVSAPSQGGSRENPSLRR